MGPKIHSYLFQEVIPALVFKNRFQFAILIMRSEKWFSIPDLDLLIPLPYPPLQLSYSMFSTEKGTMDEEVTYHNNLTLQP
jgi:hypothetical protein